MRPISLALFLLGATAGAIGADAPTYQAPSYEDCDACPTMVPIPAGKFIMGEPEYTEGTQPRSWGGPPVEISIDSPFAMAKTEITNAQFHAFVAETRYEVRGLCRSIWDNVGATWQHPQWPDAHRRPGQHPVVCVGFEDAMAYAEWLTGKAAGKRTYALPTEAQFEYAARAGDRNASPWPNAHQACERANVADRRLRTTIDSLPIVDCDDGFASTSPVAAFPPNPFRLHDMVGNVWEWILDCSSDDYATLPRDGSARAGAATSCTGRQTRGGSFVSSRDWLRYSARGGIHPVPGSNHVALGFRVVASENRR